MRIAPDGNITILTITEMGQGSGTSIPLMIAEEMDADWNKVTLDWAPSNPDVYGWPDRSGRRVMSLVGPRPPIESEVQKYEHWQLRRLAVKPGLTCHWQVR